MPLASDIEPHINDASLILPAVPQNPTGTTIPKEELENLRPVLKENKSALAMRRKLYVFLSPNVLDA